MKILSTNNLYKSPIKFTSSQDIDENADNTAFNSLHYHKNAPTKVKVGVAATTLLGITAVMANVFKKKNIPFNSPKKFFKALTSIKYDKDKHEVEKLVAGLALGSVGGGLIGGAIFDKKENFKAKAREAIIQLVGNIFTPLACVSAGMWGIEALEKKIPNILKSGTKTTKAAELVVSLGCLVSSIILGNKIGNTINKKVFHIDDERKLKLADMSPHIDDLCLVSSLVAKEIEFVPRLIPLALVIAGFSTGSTQENEKNLLKK